MNLLARLATGLFSGASQRHVAGSRPRAGRSHPVATIAPPPRFAWDEKGWQRALDGQRIRYIGLFRVFDRHRQVWRSFQGCIVQTDDQIIGFCADPPPEIKAHPKGPCFMLSQAPWFRIHWRRAPKTVDEVLLYVERLLDECLNDERR